MRKGLGAVLIASIIIAGIGDAQGPTRGGKLTYGRYADSLFLDPVFTDANLDIWIMQNIYETLIQTGPGGKGLVPGLATTWSFSKDGKTFTLTLRSGLKFSNGTPVTGDDVKFSLDRARNEKNGAWNFLLGSISSVSTKGNQVVIALKNPDPSLPAALATFNSAILPKKLYGAAKGSDEKARAKVFGEKPVGTGPFVLSEWKRGTSMTLKRNPNYWRKGSDGRALPYLDEVKFEIVPDDNARILKLQSGELDGAEFIPFARVAELQADPKINMKLFPSTRVNFVVMNTRPKLKDGTENPLSNLKLRKALNYATDKQALIRLVTFGLGKPMRSYLSSSTPLFAPQTMYPFNLEKAKTLFAESGVAEGTEIAVQIVAGSADQIALTTALQQMWDQIGVKLKIDQFDSATTNSKYQDTDFQMQVNYWTDDIADPNELTAYAAVFESSESFKTGFKNDEVEKLFTQTQAETNTTKRTEMYRRIQQIHTEAAPMIFLYEQPFAVALSKKLRDFVQTPLGVNVFSNAYLEK
jgi:peptide/nickel transport system substrate-binding protein